MYIIRKAALPLNFLLLAAIVYMLVDTGLFFWTGYQNPAALQAGSAVQAKTQSTVLNANTARLFGVTAAKPRKVITKAPETRLQLELLGILTHPDDNRSSAIISEKNNKKTGIYRIKDQIIPGTHLAAIEDDKVLLERQGSPEILRFEPTGQQGKSAFRPRSVPSRQPIPANNSSPPPQVTQAPQETPKPLTRPKVVKKTPKSETRGKRPPMLPFGVDVDEAGHYLITDNSDLGRWLNLKPGDKILLINGKVASKVINNPVSLGLIVAAGSAELTIKRGGEQITITPSFR